MKKIIFLLLCTVSIYGQTLQNPTFGNTTTNTIKVKTNSVSTTALDVGVLETDGSLNKMTPTNLPIPQVPLNYSVLTPNIGGHLSGIDLKLGALSGTTAGISTRVWFTADQTTITAGTFDLTNATSKGTVASHQQTVANDDNQKKYFTIDLIGQPFAMATTFPAGTYAGSLSASTTPTNANQKFTVELYRCNNAGTPIASGVTGAVTGSLGVTVIMIMDSGEVTLANASITNVPVSTNLGAGGFTINTGERIRYHVSAEKVGTAGGVINESVYYGNSYNSFIDVPVIYNSTSIKDVSTVTNGTGTVTDALNTLKTNFDYVTPNEFTGTDIQKIQAALNYAVSNNKTLLINRNQASSSNVWLIDSAILLKSNSKIIIDNVTIQLSNTSRDNVFRTENTGIGITNPSSNILSNISITGRGKAELKGASNPRSTGDWNKTLSTTLTATFGYSYGSDTGVAGQAQTGDWRNIGMLFGYANNITLKGLTFTDMHAWAVSFERCKNLFVSDIILDTKKQRTIASTTQNVKNLDGIDFTIGCSNITLKNVSGFSDDNNAILAIIPEPTKNAGDLGTMKVTGGTYTAVTDDIHDVTFSNFKTSSIESNILILNTASKITNVTINDIEDTSTSAVQVGSTIIIGSSSPTYGGTTPLGNCSGFNISNIKTVNALYSIRIEGSLTESTITGLTKINSSGAPILFYSTPTLTGARNLSVSNIIHNGVSIDYSSVIDGALGEKTGVTKDNGGIISISKFETPGIEIKNPISTPSDVLYRSGTARRWILRRETTAETGSNAGSNFEILRVSDSNSIIGTPISINRATGVVTLETLAGTGTRQVVADASGNLSATTPQPLKYIALLNQTSTNAPVATVNENTLGGTVVWTRSSTGVYVGTLSGAFTSLAKVRIFLTNGALGSPYSIGGEYNSINDVRIATVGTSAVSDNILTNASIQILVYP